MQNNKQTSQQGTFEELPPLTAEELAQFEELPPVEFRPNNGTPVFPEESRGFFDRVSDSYHDAIQYGTSGTLARMGLDLFDYKKDELRKLNPNLSEDELEDLHDKAISQTQKDIRDTYGRIRDNDAVLDGDGVLDTVGRAIPTIGGELLGSASPADLLGIGLGNKVFNSFGGKVLESAAIGGLVNGFEDGLFQFLDKVDGVREEYSLEQLLGSVAVGSLFGGTLRGISEGLSNGLPFGRGKQEGVSPTSKGNKVEISTGETDLSGKLTNEQEMVLKRLYKEGSADQIESYLQGIGASTNIDDLRTFVRERDSGEKVSTEVTYQSPPKKARTFTREEEQTLKDLYQNGTSQEINSFVLSRGKTIDQRDLKNWIDTRDTLRKDIVVRYTEADPDVKDVMRLTANPEGLPIQQLVLRDPLLRSMVDEQKAVRLSQKFKDEKPVDKFAVMGQESVPNSLKNYVSKNNGEVNSMAVARIMELDGPELYRPIMKKVRQAMADYNEVSGTSFKSFFNSQDLAPHEAGSSTINRSRNTSNAYFGDLKTTRAETVVHELIHNVTAQVKSLSSRNLLKDPELESSLDSLQKAADRVSDTLLTKSVQAGLSKEEALLRKSNFLDNPFEVLAWGLSNKNARTVLDSIPVDSKKSALDVTKDFVSKLLKLDRRERTLLNDVMSSFDSLTNKKNIGTIEKQLQERIDTAFDLNVKRHPAQSTPSDKELRRGAGNLPQESQGSRFKNLPDNKISSLGRSEDVPESVTEDLKTLNLSKLKGRKSISRILTEAQKHSPERRPVSRQEMETLADELDMDYDKFINSRGKEVTPEYLMAGRQFLLSSANNLGRLARRWRDGDNSSQLREEIQETWLSHLALQETLTDQISNVGRTLRSLRFEVNENGFKLAKDSLENRRVSDILPAAIKDEEAFEKIVSFIADNPDQLRKLTKANKELTSPRAVDLIKRGYFSALLSGPKTHVANVVGTVSNSGLDFFNLASAAAIGQLKRFGDNPNDRVTARELGARIQGFLGSLGRAYNDAGLAYRRGAAEGGQSRYEGISEENDFSFGKSLPGKVADAPLKSLAAEDQFFRTSILNSELRGRATRMAIKEGLKGKELKERVNELVEYPTASLYMEADEATKKLQFRDTPSKLAKAFNRMKSNGRDFGSQATDLIATLFVPFVNTPDSLVRTALRNSPAGVFSPTNVRAIKAGGAERDVALARLANGTLMTGAIATWAANGAITGSGPEDFRKRMQLEATGWRPYSLKIGDTYYSYQGLEPLSINLGSIATFVENLDEVSNGKDFVDQMFNMSSSMADAMTKQTWLSNINGFIDLLSGYGEPSERIGHFVGGVAAGAVVPAAIRQPNADYIDRTKRDSTGDGSFLDRVKGRIAQGVPGVSQTLPARRDILGEEVRDLDNVGPDFLFRPEISPIRGGDTPATQELIRLFQSTDSSVLSPLERKIDGVRLEADIYQDGVKYRADFLNGELTRVLTEAPEQWAAATDEQKIEVIKKIQTAANKAAKAFMLEETDKRNGFEELPPLEVE